MHKFLLIIISSFQFHLAVRADEEAYSMDELFLNSNLIAHVKIISHTDQNFRVRVREVLHHHKSGITEGGYLKIINDFNVTCPAAFPIELAEQKREALAFLSYHNGNWHLNRGEIAFFKGANVRVALEKEGCHYNGTINNWKEDLSDYFEHFQYNAEGRIISKYDSTQIEGKIFSPLVQLQYYWLYGNLSLEAIPKLEFELKVQIANYSDADEEGPVEDEKIYTFVDTFPIQPDSLVLKMMNDLVTFTLKRYPELQQSLYANTYYSLIFEKDGRISDVKILRSVSPKIDESIKAYFQLYPQWEPAILNNRFVKCRQNFPFRLNVD
ncbi:MAG: energy transducer TonB [Flavobacteriales bacterium]|nr:energy transducer TonB [Flavobacteriales bacterium]